MGVQQEDTEQPATPQPPFSPHFCILLPEMTPTRAPTNSPVPWIAGTPAPVSNISPVCWSMSRLLEQMIENNNPRRLTKTGFGPSQEKN